MSAYVCHSKSRLYEAVPELVDGEPVGVVPVLLLELRQQFVLGVKRKFGKQLDKRRSRLQIVVVNVTDIKLISIVFESH